MITDILTLLFSILVYPGLLFLFSLALFTQYLYRKLSAHMQKRMGPTYVGPKGVLQPLFDVWKLIHVKEEVVTKYSLPLIAKFFALTGLAAAITVTALLPLSIYRIIGDYDFLVYIYLCCLWIPFSIIMMSLSMPGPYTSVGVSRILSFITVCEPAYFASLLVPVTLVSKDYSPVYSVYTASVNIWKYWLNPYTIPLLILSLIAALVILQAKAMMPPFNIPEAEQEIIAGFETEFSGPILGLGILLHDVDVTITILSIAYILLGGPYPFPHLSIPGIIVVIVKYLAIVLVSAIIENIFGRYRIEQALYVMLKYALIPALIALVLAMIYIF